MIVQLSKGDNPKGKFPKLMINTYGAIVLMHGPEGNGTLLKPMGETILTEESVSRINLYLSTFEDYIGKLTLSNEY